MVTLRFTAKGTFTAGDADRLYITRDGSDRTKFNAEVQFSVEDDSGNEIDRWGHSATDIDPLDVPSWFTAAFRSQAWADYKTSKGYTEV